MILQFYYLWILQAGFQHYESDELPLLICYYNQYKVKSQSHHLQRAACEILQNNFHFLFVKNYERNQKNEGKNLSLLNAK